MPAPAPRPRSVRACVTAALVALLAGAGGWAPARAVTAGDAHGRPGEVVEVVLSNERDQGRTPWVVLAPQGTTFEAPPTSDVGPGASDTACSLVSPTEARCEPRTVWVAGSQVRLELAVEATAPAGTTTGTSTVGDESGGFDVTVLPPPAPTLTAPATTRETSPELRGTRDVVPGSGGHGHSVTVTDADGRRLCQVPAAAQTAWSCTPSELGVGEHVLVATQSSPGGSTSPASAPQVVRVVDAVSIEQPAAGSTTTSRTVTVSGTADPGADVRVALGGQRLTVPTDGQGRFRATFEDLAPGRHRATASQQVPGVPASRDTVTFDVREVPPTRPGPGSPPRPDPSRPDPSAPGPSAPDPSGPDPAAPDATEDRDPAPTGRPPSEPRTRPAPRVPAQPAGGENPAAAAPSWSGGARDDGGAGRSADESEGRSEGRAADPSEDGAGEGGASSGAGTDGPATADRAGGPWTPSRLLPVSLSTAAVAVVPGTTSRMAARVGPNPSDEVLTVRVDGQLGRGVRYRSVVLGDAGTCTTTGARFHCEVELAPGQEATLTLHLLADAAATADRAVHRLEVSADGAGTGGARAAGGDAPGAVNAVTSVLDLTAGTPSDTDTLAAEVSGFPGPFVVVLALFLFALAATVAERGR